MNLQLQGKTALVTGSTAGIGLAIATELAREGAAVIVNGRTHERVEAAMKSSGADHGIAVDLATEAGAQAVFARFPEVDILVNNLGIFEPKPFEEIPDDDWRRFFEVNVLSGVRLSRHYIGPMKRKNWGRIVFISSESGLQIPPEMIHYGMTKTAQLGRVARPRGDNEGNGRHSKRGPSGSDSLRRSDGLCRSDGEVARRRRVKRWSANSSARCARRR